MWHLQDESLQSPDVKAGASLRRRSSAGANAGRALVVQITNGTVRTTTRNQCQKEQPFACSPEELPTLLRIFAQNVLLFSATYCLPLSRALTA